MAERTRSEGISVDFQPMSPDERDRMMQFLLTQQAQFAADFARIDATMEKLSVKTDRIADGLIGLTGIVGRAFGDVGRAMDDLAAAQKRTEGHLDVVIQMFERHLREDHGRPS